MDLSKSFQKNKKCAQCGKTFLTNKILERHLKLGHEDRPIFKCSVDQCTKEYKNKRHLRRQVRVIHLDIKLSCNFCDSTFTSKWTRDCHIVGAHTLEKSFKCGDCSLGFTSARLLRSHRNVHTDETPHRCPTCCKQFKTKEYLRLHKKRVHSTGRSRDFVCPTCQKSFFTKNDLKLHALVHSQYEDKFICYFCKISLARRSDMEAHTRIHTQEKPFACQVEACQFSSSHQSCLIKHRKGHNPRRMESKTWSCYFCSTAFSSFSNLVNHLRSHTLEEPFACGLCQKSFKRDSNLKHHISFHTKEKPFKCKECQTSFFYRDSLKRHIGAVHRQEKRFFCEFCSYSAYSKINFHRHTLRLHNN